MTTSWVAGWAWVCATIFLGPDTVGISRCCKGLCNGVLALDVSRRHTTDRKVLSDEGHLVSQS